MDSKKPNWLCVPCHVRIDDAPDDEYHIYFVNSFGLSSKPDYEEGSVLKLRVSKKLNLSCFWAKGSTLYLFSRMSKSVGTLKLCEILLESSPVLSESMIRHNLTPMNYEKRSPRVVPTPDGKLLVMSSVIQSHVRPLNDRKYPGFVVGGEMRDFEIYDVDEDSWDTLPPIQPYWPCSTFQRCEVYWAVFMDQNTLLVNLEDYLFEFNRVDRIWTQKTGIFAVDAGYHITTMVNRDLCFNPYFVFSNEHWSASSFIPSSFEDHDGVRYENHRRSCFLPSSDGSSMYVVETANLRKSTNAKFSVRLYRIDIDKYDQDKMELESRRKHGIITKEEIMHLVKSTCRNADYRNASLKKFKLKNDICLVSEGKLKSGMEPLIGVQLLASFCFAIPSCKVERIVPLASLSECEVPSRRLTTKRLLL